MVEVEKANEEFAKRREEYFKLYSQERVRIDAQRKEYESIIHALAAKPSVVLCLLIFWGSINVNAVPNQDRYFWISSEWLKGWVFGKQDLGAIDNKDIVCEHGKLSPIFLPKMKRLSLVRITYSSSHPVLLIIMPTIGWVELFVQTVSGGPNLDGAGLL